MQLLDEALRIINQPADNKEDERLHYAMGLFLCSLGMAGLVSLGTDNLLDLLKIFHNALADTLKENGYYIKEPEFRILFDISFHTMQVIIDDCPVRVNEKLEAFFKKFIWGKAII